MTKEQVILTLKDIKESMAAMLEYDGTIEHGISSVSLYASDHGESFTFDEVDIAAIEHALRYLK